MRANVTASMVSNGGVGVNADDVPDDGWWISPGETVTVPFTIWNNATQQDSYTFSFDSTGVFGWQIELLSPEYVIIGPGGNARVLVSFTAPDNAQANDPGPILTPHVTSTESGMSGTEDVFSGIRVRQLHDVTLSMNAPQMDILPGHVNEIPFEVENLGNGPENVLFDLQAPLAWNWWVEFNSAIISGPLSLSTVYDGNSAALGSLWIEVPGNEDPGQVVGLTFTASSMDGMDASPEDATFSWEYRTQMTAIPEISDFESQEVSLWLGQSESWALSLQNSGNTYDSSMRIRVTSDKNVPGMIVQAVTSRGTGQLNGWIDVPMGPGGVEEVLVIFESLDNFPLGETVRLSIEVEGGQITNQDQIHSLSTEITVSVDQKRGVTATWNLDQTVLHNPGEISTFQINVTTDSTMPVTVTLNSTTPETVFLDCRPRTQDGKIVVFMPESSPGPAQTSTIDCDISLDADNRERTVFFEVTDDLGELIWSSGPVHLKTKQIDESGGFAGLGSATILFGGLIGGIAFISFVVYMVTIIISRRRKLDEIEDLDDDEIATYGAVAETTDTVVQIPAQTSIQSPPGPMPGAPGPMPTATPIVQQPLVPVAEPSPADYTDEQLRASGWSDQQIQDLRGVPTQSVTDSFDALGVTQVAEAGTSGTSLPAFNCIVTGQVLSASDAWWQCSGCGGFAAATAIAQYTHCPTCNLVRG